MSVVTNSLLDIGQNHQIELVISPRGEFLLYYKYGNDYKIENTTSAAS